MDQTYEVVDGVRRSKAAQLAGHKMVRAKLYSKSDGKLIRELDVPIADLRSPHKNTIKRISNADKIRWLRVEKGAKQDPLPFPPIEIVEGDRGAEVKDIDFEFGSNP